MSDLAGRETGPVAAVDDPTDKKAESSRFSVRYGLRPARLAKPSHDEPEPERESQDSDDGAAKPDRAKMSHGAAEDGDDSSQVRSPIRARLAGSRPLRRANESFRDDGMVGKSSDNDVPYWIKRSIGSIDHSYASVAPEGPPQPFDGVSAPAGSSRPVPRRRTARKHAKKALALLCILLLIPLYILFGYVVFTGEVGTFDHEFSILGTMKVSDDGSVGVNTKPSNSAQLTVAAAEGGTNTVVRLATVSQAETYDQQIEFGRQTGPGTFDVGASIRFAANRTTSTARTLGAAAAGDDQGTVTIEADALTIGPRLSTPNTGESTSILLNGTTRVTGTTDLEGNVTSHNSHHIRSDLSVSQATVLQGTLSTGSSATVGGSLGVAGTATLSSSLTVVGDTSLLSDLSVGRDLAVQSDLSVAGSTSTGALSASGATSLGSQLSVGGATLLGSALTVSSDAHLSSALHVGGTASVGSLTSGGATVLEGTLRVDGLTTSSDITARSVNANLMGTHNLDVSGALSVVGPSALGDLSASGAASFGSALSVAGSAAFSSSLTVSGASAMGSALSVAGRISAEEVSAGSVEASGSLSVAGSTTLSSMTASGASITGALSVGGNISAAGSLSSAGTITASSLSVTGASSLGSLRVNGTLNATTLTSPGNMTIANLNVTGASVLRSLDVGGVATVDSLTSRGAAKVASVTSDGTIAGGALDISGASALAGALSVGGSASFGSNVAIDGSLAAAGPITAQSLNVSGNVTAGGWVVAGEGIAGRTLSVSGPAAFGDTVHVATPSLDPHAATKGYVDNALVSLEERLTGLNLSELANLANGTWPQGSYCILRRGYDCPDGFSKGYLSLSSSGISLEFNGSLPDGEYSGTMRKLWYCCRGDGLVCDKDDDSCGNEILDSTSVQPADLTAGATGNVTVTLRVRQRMPDDGRVNVTFPDGFAPSSGGATQAFPGQNMDGSLTVLAVSMNPSVLVQRSGGATDIQPNTLISFVLTNIRNPPLVGPTGTFGIRTLTVDGDLIDADTNVTGVSVQAAPLSSSTVTLSNSTAGAATVLTFSFTTRNPVPADGRVTVGVPSGFSSLSGATLAVASVSAGTFGSASQTSSSNASHTFFTLTRGGSSGTIAGGTTFSLTLSTPRNPGESGDSGSFTIRTALGSGALLDEAPLVSGTTLSPAALLDTSISLSQARAGDSSSASFSFTTFNEIPSNGKIVVVFPSGAGFALGGVSATAVSGIDGSLGVSTSGATVTLTRSGGSASAAGAKVVALSGLKNPHVSGTTGAFAVTTATAGDTAIDENSAFATVTILPGVLGSGAVTVVESKAGASGAVNVSFVPRNPIPREGIIDVELPVGFAPSGTLSALLLEPADGFGASTTLSATLSGQTLRIVRANSGNDGSSVVNRTVTVQVSAIRNPQVSGTTGTFVISTKTSALAEIDRADDLSGVVIAVNDLGGVDVAPASLVAGASGNAMVSFTTSNPIPSDGSIDVTFPSGFALSTTSASSSSIAGTLSASVSGQVVTISRSGGAAAASGTLSVLLNGVRNPQRSGATGSYAVTTRAASGGSGAGNAIDSGSDSGDTLTPGPLRPASVVPASLVAGDAGTVSASFTSSNPIANGGRIALSLPSGFTFDTSTLTLSSATLAGANVLSSLSIVSPGTPITSGTFEISLGADVGAGTWAIALGAVRNPAVSGETGTFGVETRTPDGGSGRFVIDSNATADAVTIAPGQLVSPAVSMDTALAGAVGTATVRFTTKNAIGATGRITVAFPSGFELNAAGTTSAAAVANVSGALSASVSGQTVTVARSGGSAIGESVVVSFSLSNVRLPRVSGTTGAFALTTQTSGGTIVDASASGTPGGISIVPNALSGVQVLPGGARVAGAQGSLSVTFSATNPIPSDGKVLLQLSGLFTLNSGGSSAATSLTTGKIDGSFSVTSSTTGSGVSSVTTVTITRSGGAATSVGESGMQLQISNVRNPEFAGETVVPYNVSTSASSGALIDVATNVGDERTIAVEAIQEADLALSTTATGSLTNVTISFSNGGSTLPSAGYIVVRFPSGFSFPSAPSVTVTPVVSGSSVLSGQTLSGQVDTGTNVVTVTTSAAVAAGASPIAFQIWSVRNPDAVGALSPPFQINTTTGTSLPGSVGERSIASTALSTGGGGGGGACPFCGSSTPSPTVSCAVQTSSASVPTSSLEDNFNTGLDSAIWNTGASSGVTISTNCGAVSGSAAYFSGAGTRALVSNALDLSTGGDVQFAIRLGSGGSPCESVDNGEDVVLEYSVNGGSSFVVLRTIESGEASTFTEMTVPLPAGARTSSTILRFRQLEHDGGGFDNFAIDNFAYLSLQIAAGDEATVRFSVSSPNGLPPNGKAKFTFPSSFNLTTVKASSGTSSADGSFATSVSGQVVTLLRTGGTLTSGTVSFVIANVTLPPVSGTTAALGTAYETSSGDCVAETANVPGVNITAHEFQTAPAVSLADARTGAVDTATFSFTTFNPIPANGKVRIEFPAASPTFSLASAALASESIADGGLSFSRSGSVIELTRSSASAPLPKSSAVEIVLSGVTNPSVSASIGGTTVTSQTATGVAIDTGVVANVTVGPNVLSPADVSTASLEGIVLSDEVGNASVTFLTTNAVSSGGSVRVVFPSGFTLSSGGTTSVVSATPSGSFASAVSVSGQNATLSVSSTIASGTSVSAVLSHVKNPSYTSENIGSTGAYAIETAASGGALIDRNASVPSDALRRRVGSLVVSIDASAIIKAGSVGDLIVTFSPSFTLENDGLIVVTLPSEYAVNAGGTTAAQSVSLSGSLSVVGVSGQSVTVRRNSDGTAVSAGTHSFRLTRVRSPTQAGGTGPFAVQTRRSASYVIDQNTTVAGPTIVPNDLTSASVSVSASTAGAATSLLFSFGVFNEMPANGVLRIQLPSTAFQQYSFNFNGTTAFEIVQNMQGSFGSVSINTTTYTLEATRLATSAVAAGQGGVQVRVTHLRQPVVSGSVGSAAVTTLTSGGGAAIDAASIAIPVVSAAALLPPTSLVSTDVRSGAVPVLTMTLTLENALAANGKLEVTFPTSFTLGSGGSVGVGGQSGVDGGFSVTSETSTRRVTMARDGSGSAIAEGTTVVLNITNVQNPPFAGTTSAFQFATRASNDELIDVNNAVPGLTIVPNVFVYTNVSLSVLNSGSETNVTFMFEPTNDVPRGSRIVVGVPSGFALNFGGSTGVLTSANISGSFTSAVDAGARTVTLTRDTFITTTALSKGTVVSVTISHVRTRQSGGATSGFSVTTRSSSGAVYDEASDISGPALIPGVLKAASVTPSSLVAGASVNVSVSLTLRNSIASNGVIEVVFPSGFTLPSSVSVVGTSGAVSGETLSGSVSGQTLKVQRGGSSALAADSVVTFNAIGSFVNPGVTGGSGAFTVRTLTPDESGIIDAGEAAEVTLSAGALTSASVALANPPAKAGSTATLRVSFTIANALASGDFVRVAMPSGFVASSSVGASASAPGGATFGASALSGGSVVELQLTSSGGASSGTSFVIDVSGVRVPEVSGTSGTFSLETRAAGSSNATRDSATNLSGVTISANDLSGVSASLASGLRDAGDVGTVTVTFTTVNPVPVDGRFVIGMDAEFSASAGTSSASGTVGGSGMSGTLSVSSIAGSGGKLVATIVRSGGGSEISGGSTIAISVTSVTNPGYAQTTEAFDVSTGTSSGAVIDSGSSSGGVTIGASELTSASVSLSPSSAGSIAEATVSFVTDNAVPSGGGIVVEFPTDTVPDATSSMSVVVTSPSGLSGVSASRVSGNAQHVLVQWSSGSVSGGASVSLRLSDVRNRGVSGSSGTFVIRTYQESALTHVIDEGEAGAVTISAGLLSASVSLGDVRTSVSTTVDVVVSPLNSWPANGKLRVVFPSGFSGSGASSAGFVAGGSGSLSVSGSASSVTLTRSGGSPISSAFTVRIGGIITAGVSGVTGNFSVETETTSNDDIDTGSASGVALVAGSFSNDPQVATVASALTGRTGALRFTFVPRAAVPTNGKVRITLPSAFSFAAGASGASIVGGSPSASSVTNATSGGSQIVLTATYASGISEGTSVTLDVSNFVYPGTAEKTANTSIVSLNAAGDREIDTGSADGLMISAAPFASLTTSSPTTATGANAQYTFTFTLGNNSVPAGGAFRIALPSEYSLGSVTAVALSGISGSLGAVAADGATAVVVPRQGDGSAIAAGTLVSLRLDGVVNAKEVVPSPTATVRTQSGAGSTAVAIEESTADLPGLTANAFSATEVALSDYRASAEPVLQISVVLANPLPAGGARIEVVAPSQFQVNATGTAIGTVGGDVVPATVSTSSQTITLVRTGGAAVAAGTRVNFTVAGVVKNPGFSVTTSTGFSVASFNGSRAIDQGTGSPLTITPGSIPLIVTTLAPSGTGQASSVRIEFNNTNPIPANGRVVVKFPSAFSAAGTLAFNSGASTSNIGTGSVAESGGRVQLTVVRSGLAPVPSGTMTTLQVDNVRNPGVLGVPSGTFDVETEQFLSPESSAGPPICCGANKTGEAVLTSASLVSGQVTEDFSGTRLRFSGDANGKIAARTSATYSVGSGASLDIRAQANKTHTCSDHFMYFSASTSEVWNWARTAGVVRVAWNCNSMVIYTANEGPSLSCPANRLYNVSVTINEQAIMFDVPACGSLSAAWTLGAASFYTYIGADQDEGASAPSDWLDVTVGTCASDANATCAAAGTYTRVDAGSNSSAPVTCVGVSASVALTGSAQAGEIGSVNISYTAANTIPVDAKFKITFPSGFDVSGSLTASSSAVSGALSASASGQLVTVSRGSGASALSAGDAVHLVIGGVRNPRVAGSAGDFVLEVASASDTCIEEDESAGAIAITPGNLTVASLSLSDARVGAQAVSTVRFTATNGVPAGGMILVVYPAGFDLASSSPSASIVSGLVGSLSAAVSGQTLTLTRTSGASVAAGTIVELQVTGPANPGQTGATGTAEFATETSSGARIDERTDVAGTTITVSPMGTPTSVEPPTLQGLVIGGQNDGINVTVTTNHTVPSNGFVTVQFIALAGWNFNATGSAGVSSSNFGATSLTTTAAGLVTVRAPSGIAADSTAWFVFSDTVTPPGPGDFDSQPTSTGTITVTTKAPGGTADINQVVLAALSVRDPAGALTGTSIRPVLSGGTAKAGAVGSVEIEFRNQNGLPSTSRFRIVFPDGFAFNVGGTTAPSIVAGTINGGLLVAETITNNTVVVAMDGTGISINPGTVVRFALSHVRNPELSISSHSATLQAGRSDGFVIDENTTVPVDAIVTNALSSVSLAYASGSATAGADTNVTVSFTTFNPVPRGGRLRVELPNDGTRSYVWNNGATTQAWFANETVADGALSVVSVSQPNATSGSNAVIVVERTGASTAIASSASVELILSHVRLPQVSGTAGTFTVQTQSDVSGNALIDEGSGTVASVSAGNIAVGAGAVALANSTRGANTTVTFTFNVTNPVPASSRIIVGFPPGFSLQPSFTGVALAAVSGGATVSTGTAAVTSFVASNANVVRAGNGADIPAGSTVTLSLTGVEIPGSAGTTDVFEVSTILLSNVAIDVNNSVPGVAVS